MSVWLHERERLGLDPLVVAAADSLEREISVLRVKVAEARRDLFRERTNSEEQARAIEQVKASQARLEEKERIRFVLDRVSAQSHKVLFEDGTLRETFLSSGAQTAFVMSVDLRRSTELMLKARRPELFARFLTDLCHSLQEIVKSCNGVFDKFTGDGILAFFPEFFTGEDAVCQTLIAADQAHECFKTIYSSHRTTFTTVLKDVGLGIGIDHGEVNLVQPAV